MLSLFQISDVCYSHDCRKLSPIWYPVSRPITIQHLIEFIHEHTGLVADNDVGKREEGGVVRSESEEMGWRLWQYSEKEEQKVEADNRQLAERLNKIAEERAVSQLVTEESGDVMSQLETLLKRVLADESRVTPARAEGSTTPTRAEGSTTPTRAEGSTTPTRAERLTTPTRAEGSTTPTRAEGEESSTTTLVTSSEVLCNATSTGQSTVSRS